MEAIKAMLFQNVDSELLCTACAVPISIVCFVAPSDFMIILVKVTAMRATLFQNNSLTDTGS